MLVFMDYLILVPGVCLDFYHVKITHLTSYCYKNAFSTAEHPLNI
jgi:hypothetical protein